MAAPPPGCIPCDAEYSFCTLELCATFPSCIPCLPCTDLCRPPAPAPAPSVPSSGPSSIPAGAIAAGVIAPVVILVLAALGCIYVRRKRKRTEAGSAGEEAPTAPRSELMSPEGQSSASTEPMYPEEQSSASTRRRTVRATESGSFSSTFLPALPAGPRRFSYEELSKATSNFSDSELLGRGGTGFVYKGKLDHALVAVKRIEESSIQADKAFQAEVTIISDLRHRNLVRLRGWCCDKGNLLLVYDYMSNGSLDYLLFDDTLCAKLTWERRESIASGLGSALHYLHDECDYVIIHRDIKSSNVLLDESFTAKLGDFGLSRKMDQGITSHKTILAGTRGYMAPECLIGFSKATRETDVYAFGVVLLELVSGKCAADARRFKEYKGKLVEWVWHLHKKGRLLEAVDERLRGMYKKEEATRMLVVGLRCCSADPKARPKMRYALDTLKGNVALPSVPLSKSHTAESTNGFTVISDQFPGSTASSSGTITTTSSTAANSSSVTDYLTANYKGITASSSLGTDYLVAL